MSYNSKYTGEQVEGLLDQIANGEIGGGIESETDPIFSASPAATITENDKVAWNSKQDAISDLESIRDGASKGATALQSIPEEYVTEEQLLWTKSEGEAGVRLKGTNGTATGNLAISAGDDKTASDGTEYKSVASGDHAVAFGFGNTCAGRTTLAQGLYNTINGKDSVAFGQRNLVNGDQAFAVGQQNEVAARLGVAIGYKNKATNTDSIAIGYQNTSGGSASVAMGDSCEANGTSSTAMGYKTKATGSYSSTFGQSTQATNSGEVAMGLYNKSTTSTDASEQTAFSFGIGTSDTARANAFEIKKNGDVYIGDKLLSGDGITEETDPIFSASPAASITDNKIEEWNNKVDKVTGKGLSTEDFTSALKTKLESLSNYDDTELSDALSTLRGDFDELVSGDTTTAIKTFNEVIAFLDGIQDSQDLSGIIASIEQQIAGKMNEVTLATVATSGSYNDLKDKPTIPAEQVNADWNATSGKAQILNKPTIPSAVTESTVSGWGFTKNTGTYSKPSGGIPKSDLASAVQTSLGKADTALQSYTEQYRGTITGVSANGTSIATSGVANIPAASTSAYGVTKLSSSTSSTSTTLAATASAVKVAYDLANSYKGTVTGVKVNGSTKSPSSGTVDIGNIVTSVKLNGTTYSPSSGVVDLGTISGGESGGGSTSESSTKEVVVVNATYYSYGTYAKFQNILPNKIYICEEVVDNVEITFNNDTSSKIEDFTVMFKPNSSTTLSIGGIEEVIFANGNTPKFDMSTMYELSLRRYVSGLLKYIFCCGASFELPLSGTDPA